MAPFSWSLWRPIQRVSFAASVLICHAALAGIFLLIIWSLERFIYLLWDGRERLLLDLVPLRYMFDSMDFAVLMIFAYFGLWDVVEALTSRTDADAVAKLSPPIDAE